MPNVIGIDPGLTGAIAVLSETGELLMAVDMPAFQIGGKNKIDVHGLGNELKDYARNSRAVIELVSSQPKEGVVSAFSFGFATGAVHGAIGSLGIPLETVTPAKWKRYFRIPKDKDAARQLAVRKWPHGPFSRKKDAGRAEAALIALWALETAVLGKADK